MADIAPAVDAAEITITQAFDSQDQFSQLLRRLQFTVAQVTRLIQQEGIERVRVLGQTRIKDLESSMQSVNHLFGNNTTARNRIYFSHIHMQRLTALSAYIKRCLHASRILDVRLITLDSVNVYILSLETWTESSGDVEDIIKQTAIKFDPTKFVNF